LLLALAMCSVTAWAETMWRWMFPSAAFGHGSTTRTHKILVVDASFSMGLRDGNSTAFDKARDLAADLVKNSPRGDAFSVVRMSWPRGAAVVSEASEDADKVLREVQNLKPTDGNADLPATLNIVANLLQSSPPKFLHREVYFFTDLQKSTWLL